MATISPANVQLSPPEWLQAAGPENVLKAVLLVIWGTGFRWSGYDQICFMISLVAALLYYGFGQRGAGDRYSAYSIFNSDGKHLLGDLRAEQIDAEQRGDQYLQNFDNAGGLIDLPDAVDDADGDEPPQVRSRDANKPCKCGSGLKAKKCCYAPRSKHRSTAGASRQPAVDAAVNPRWLAQMEVVDGGHS